MASHLLCLSAADGKPALSNRNILVIKAKNTSLPPDPKKWKHYDSFSFLNNVIDKETKRKKLDLKVPEVWSDDNTSVSESSGSSTEPKRKQSGEKNEKIGTISKPAALPAKVPIKMPVKLPVLSLRPQHIPQPQYSGNVALQRIGELLNMLPTRKRFSLEIDMLKIAYDAVQELSDSD